MNLLFSRSQSAYSIIQFVPLRFGRGVTFLLKAELELDEEEKALIKKYQMSNGLLFDGSFWMDLLNAIKSSFLFWLFAAVPFLLFGHILPSVFGTASIGGQIGIWQIILALFVLCAVFVMPFVYFFALRQSVRVRHLINGGRTFRCDSVVDLIHKEAAIESMCAYLRQLLESAKTWDDREIIPIQPLDKLNAKLAVLKAMS